MKSLVRVHNNPLHHHPTNHITHIIISPKHRPAALLAHLLPSLTGRHKPQALPDLPPEFMEVGEWRYLIAAKNGIEKASLNRIRTATASTMNLEEMLWLVFQDLLVKQPEQYHEFFSEIEPWPYIPNSMTNWIRPQVEELIKCPPSP